MFQTLVPAESPANSLHQVAVTWVRKLWDDSRLSANCNAQDTLSANTQMNLVNSQNWERIFVVLCCKFGVVYYAVTDNSIYLIIFQLWHHHHHHDKFSCPVFHGRHLDVYSWLHTFMFFSSLHIISPQYLYFFL